MTQSQTTVVSLQQLAELADLEPRFFYKHRAELPESTPVHDGVPGRPQLHFNVADIVEFVLSRTEFMSEIECRLRLALAPESRRRPPKQIRIVDKEDGGHILVPTDLSQLPSEDIALFKADRLKNLRDLQNRRLPTPTDPVEE